MSPKKLDVVDLRAAVVHVRFIAFGSALLPAPSVPSPAMENPRKLPLAEPSMFKTAVLKPWPDATRSVSSAPAPVKEKPSTDWISRSEVTLYRPGGRYTPAAGNLTLAAGSELPVAALIVALIAAVSSVLPLPTAP